MATQKFESSRNILLYLHLCTMTTPSHPILSYPLPKTDARGFLHVFGDPNSKHLVIVSGGYPDNHGALTPLARRLAEESGCLVGVTSPPGFDTVVPFTDYPVQGFQIFPDWGVTLKEAVKTLRGYSTRPPIETTLSGVFHDWGVILGYIWANQTTAEGSTELTPDRFVSLDVLLGPHPDAPKLPMPNNIKEDPKKNTKTMVYQLFLAGSFFLNRYIGPYLTLVYWFVGWKVLTFFKCMPVNTADLQYMREEIPGRTIQDVQRQFYLSHCYVQLWKMIFSGQIVDFADLCCLPLDLKAIPVLYLYGADKPLDLGDARSVALLEAEKAAGRPSRVVRLEGAGHWVHIQKPDECFHEIQKFFQDSNVPSS
jgi:pimeloyl-ACP methyl ester carboxylesterase